MDSQLSKSLQFLWVLRSDCRFHATRRYFHPTIRRQIFPAKRKCNSCKCLDRPLKFCHLFPSHPLFLLPPLEAFFAKPPSPLNLKAELFPLQGCQKTGSICHCNYFWCNLFSPFSFSNVLCGLRSMQARPSAM